MTFVFCTTMDEAVQQNPWDAITVDRNFFYDLVVQNIIVGNRLVFHAEDIFRHPILRQELVETNKSLARTLVQLGQIHVLGELRDPPAVFHIHAKKIASVQALFRNHNATLTRPPEAAINSEFSGILQRLPLVNPAAAGFFIGDIPEREYSLIVASFFKRAGVGGAGRELFQQLLDRLYGQTQGPWQSAGKRKLMQLMADVDACATARALSKQLQQPVAVDTQWAPLIGREVPYKALQMAPLSGPVSLIKLPWPNALYLPKIVQKIVQESEVGDARQEFVRAWRDVTSAGAVTASGVERLRQRAEDYNRHLHQLTAKTGDKDTMGNPANLLLSFEPTSFKGAPVLGEIYWLQAFSGVRRLMALWNFTGSDTGAVDGHTLPSYQLVYAKKKLACIVV